MNMFLSQLWWKLVERGNGLLTLCVWFVSLVWAKELLILVMVMGGVYVAAWKVTPYPEEKSTQACKSMSGMGRVVLTNRIESTNAVASVPANCSRTNGTSATVCVVTNDMPFELSVQENVVASSDVWAKAFVGLFSADVAAKTSPFMMLLFFVTWLVGGGVLVSVFVGRYNHLKAGYFRKWFFQHRRHVVVLGWDDGAVAEVVKAMDGMVPQLDCYVVTQQDVSAVERQLKSCGVKYVWVYKGDYDDMKELGRLRWKNARRVIIMGERKEDAHDARVKMLYESVKEKLAKDNASRNTQVEIVANIDDFGLANELRQKDNGVWVNFHRQWAEGICNVVLSGKSRMIGKAQTAPWFLIVGSGAMGQAIALTVCERFRDRSDIWIVDDDDEKLKAEEKRFGWEYPEKKSLVTFHADEWCKLLDGTTRLPEVVIVAKKKSEKGMSCLLALLKTAKDSKECKTVWALGQEVRGDAKEDMQPREFQISGFKVWLFGMRCGCNNNESARDWRNPYAETLRQYAEKKGSEFAGACGVPGVTAVLGGALAYDAALRGNYDIDMRLLVPGAWSSPETQQQIDKVMEWLVSRAKAEDVSPAEPRFIGEGGSNYIQHVKWIVKIPCIDGNPDVELSWNVQAKQSYRGLAGVAARLPQTVLDAYVERKWFASRQGKDEYDLLKKEWRTFLIKLVDVGVGKGTGILSESEFNELLRKAKGFVPFFLV